MKEAMRRFVYRWRMNPTRQSVVEGAGVILLLLLIIPMLFDPGGLMVYRPAGWRVVQAVYIAGVLLLMTVTGILLAAERLKYRRRRRRTVREEIRCPNCSYDVRSSHGRCPECGEIVGHGSLAIYDARVPPRPAGAAGFGPARRGQRVSAG